MAWPPAQRLLLTRTPLVRDEVPPHDQVVLKAALATPESWSSFLATPSLPLAPPSTPPSLSPLPPCLALDAEGKVSWGVLESWRLREVVFAPSLGPGAPITILGEEEEATLPALTPPLPLLDESSLALLAHDEGVERDAQREEEEAARQVREEAEREGALQAHLHLVLTRLQAHKDAWPFLRPVTTKEAPGYHEVIKTPMDLGTMATRLEQGCYKSLPAFSADLSLIWDNCFRFNIQPTSPFRAYATTLRLLAEKLLADLPAPPPPLPRTSTPTPTLPPPTPLLHDMRRRFLLQGPPSLGPLPPSPLHGHHLPSRSHAQPTPRPLLPSVARLLLKTGVEGVGEGVAEVLGDLMGTWLTHLAHSFALLCPLLPPSGPRAPLLERAALTTLLPRHSRGGARELSRLLLSQHRRRDEADLPSPMTTYLQAAERRRQEEAPLRTADSDRGFELRTALPLHRHRQGPPSREYDPLLRSALRAHAQARQRAQGQEEAARYARGGGARGVEPPRAPLKRRREDEEEPTPNKDPRLQ